MPSDLEVFSDQTDPVLSRKLPVGFTTRDSGMKNRKEVQIPYSLLHQHFGRQLVLTGTDSLCCLFRAFLLSLSMESALGFSSLDLRRQTVMFMLEHPELCLDDTGLFVLQDSASQSGVASHNIKEYLVLLAIGDVMGDEVVLRAWQHMFKLPICILHYTWSGNFSATRVNHLVSFQECPFLFVFYPESCHYNVGVLPKSKRLVAELVPKPQ